MTKVLFEVGQEVKFLPLEFIKARYSTGTKAQYVVANNLSCGLHRITPEKYVVQDVKDDKKYGRIYVVNGFWVSELLLTALGGLDSFNYPKRLGKY